MKNRILKCESALQRRLEGGGGHDRDGKTEKRSIIWDNDGLGNQRKQQQQA